MAKLTRVSAGVFFSLTNRHGGRIYTCVRSDHRVNYFTTYRLVHKFYAADAPTQSAAVVVYSVLFIYSIYIVTSIFHSFVKG